LLSRTYGYPVTACCIVDRAGAIRAGMPLAFVASRLTGRRLVCVPFADQCAALTTPDAPEAGEALVTALEDLGRLLRVPIRVHGELPPGRAATVSARYHGHTLGLEGGFDAVVRGFRRRSAILRGARRAVREGLIAERRTDAEALDAFYALNVMTRRRLGVPVQPRRFVRGLEDLLRRGLGFVTVVRDGPRPVAAAVFLTHRGTLLYKYGASDPGALGKRPNNLLFLEAIRWGCEDGMQRLDFGRTDIGHETLRAFKESWGADERIVEYHALGETRATSGDGALAARAAPLLRRAPPLVGRAVGELLYRHTG
jgi:CelD/BcsL family acetyltransferase involved in cellulose biosynthesis